MRKLLLLAGMLCFASIVWGQDIPLPQGGRLFQDSISVIYDLVAQTRDNAKVFLQWQNPSPAGIDFFTIERSCNGQPFDVIGVLRQSSGHPMREWTDEAPAKGKNIYRIRCTLQNGSTFISEGSVAMVAGDISFRFYPNPVDQILIIRSESPVDIQILDGNGKVRIQKSQLQGLQLINVADLEKGIYFLRAQNREANSFKQEKLLKN